MPGSFAHFTFIALIALCAIAGVVIWITNHTSRLRQWLMYSITLGLPVGLLWSLWFLPNSLINQLTVFSGFSQQIELTVLIGLGLGVVNFFPRLVRVEAQISHPVVIAWPKYAATLIALILIGLVGAAFPWPYEVSLGVLLVLFGLISTTQNWPKLAAALIAALTAAVVLSIVSIVIPLLFPHLSGLFQLGPLHLAANWQAWVIVSSTAFAYYPLTNWWLSQPVKKADR